MDMMITKPSTSCIAQDTKELHKRPLSCLFSHENAASTRAAFSALETTHLHTYVDDLGDLATEDLQKIHSLIVEYAEADHPLLVFLPAGASNQMGASFWSSYHYPVLVSSHVLTNQPDVAHLGIQHHYFDSSWDFQPNKHLRLGTVRQYPEQAEVLLRTSDCVVVRADALRYADNVGSPASGPAGLTTEELCMIAKYAGASTHLRTIIIEGFESQDEVQKIQSQIAALLTYYVLDGYKIRQEESASSELLQRYSVMPEHISQELVFVEDQRSSRWWVELYSEGAEDLVLLPCSRRDYEDACQNKISDRITSLITTV